MSKGKKLVSVIAASLVLSLTACSNQGGEPVAYLENPPEGAEKDFIITYDQWNSEYKFNLLNGGYTEEDNPDAAKSYRQSILDYQVRERMVLYLAKGMGITAEGFTDQEIEAVNEGAQSMLQGAKDLREEEAKKLLGDAFTEEELEKKKTELLDGILKECGYTTDIFTTWKTNEMIQQKFIDKASENISEDQINALIQENVDKAKEYYETDIEIYQQHYTPFYIPEGSRIVQQIVILIDDTAKSQIAAYRGAGDNEMANSLLEEELKKIKSTAEAAYKKLESGEAWDKVQQEYNEDKETNGIDFTVYPKSSTVEQGITDAAMSIEKKGDYSQIEKSDSGYFILMYKDDAKLTDADMESLRDQARDYLKDEEAYKLIEDFQEKYTFLYDYKLLNLDDPGASEAAA